MATTSQIVQQLYIAYFGRPADPAGADNAAKLINWSGSPAALLTDFGKSAEYTSQFSGLTPAQIVQKIYTNLFGRSAEAAGLQFWSAKVGSGEIPLSTATWTILAGVTAGSGDDVAISSKVTYAEAFTAKLAANAAAAVAYNSTTLDLVKTQLTTITSAATLATANTGLDAFVSSVVTTGASGGGSTFTLTTGVDSLTGTSGNDTFVASGAVTAVAGTPFTAGSTSLNTADKLVGGLGTDALNFTVEGAEGSTAAVYSAPAGDISGIEVINVRNVATAGTDTLTVNAGNFVGATGFYSDRSTTDMAFTNVAAGSTVGFKGNGTNAATGNVTATYLAGVTAANVSLQGGDSTTAGANTAILTVNGANLTSATITASGGGTNTINGVAFGGAVTALTVDAQSNIATGNITGLAAATKITVKGVGTANIGTLQAANVTEVDASANTGGVTATLNDVTGLKFTGGAGDDVLTTGAVLAGAGLVDAAAGTADRLVVADSTHVTVTAGKLYKGFEQLQVNDGVSVDVTQLATNNTIAAIRINDAGGATGVTNLSAAQAAAVSIVASGAGAITIGVKDAIVGGNIDTVKAAVTTTTTAGAAQAMDLTGMIVTGVEKLELAGTGTVAATTGAITFTTAAATSLDSIKFANAANGNVITIDGGHTAVNLVVDASTSTGGVTVNASAYATATGATLKGGASFDVLQGAAARSDTITGGAGNDVISNGATGAVTAGTATAIGSVAAITASTAADTLTGGEGRDMFALGVNSAVTTISSITDLNLGGSAAATGVDGLTFDMTAGAAVIATLSDTQKANVLAAATLTAALDLVIAANDVQNTVTQFVYGTDTYLVVNAAAASATYAATTDAVVKITGVTGTLDISDITIV